MGKKEYIAFINSYCITVFPQLVPATSKLNLDEAAGLFPTCVPLCE